MIIVEHSADRAAARIQARGKYSLQTGADARRLGSDPRVAQHLELGMYLTYEDKLSLAKHLSDALTEVTAGR
jgi:hypothetical protein